MRKGYWYIAYGPRRFLEEAACSAASLRRVDPEAHITLLTDQGGYEDVFDHVEIDEHLHPKTKKDGLVDNKFEGKLYNLHRAPYDSTFCVDTDTYFYENCSKLFSLTRWVDLAVCQSDGERKIYSPHEPHKVMEGLNVYTNGVMVFKKSPAMLRVFKNAAEYYRNNRRLYKNKGTNVHFSAAIAEDPDIQVYTLPINYNARVRSGLSLNGVVKIAHSSSGTRKMTKKEYENVKLHINASTGYRTWHPGKGICT